MPSSVVHDIAYEPENGALTVTFTTGRVYRYYGVPPEVYEAFRIAASKGRFFNLRIRDQYKFQELAA
jgi:hypothetical protein